MWQGAFLAWGAFMVLSVHAYYIRKKFIELSKVAFKIALVV